MRIFLLFLAALTMTLVGSSQDRPAFNRGSYFSAEMRSYDRAMAAKVPVLKLTDRLRSVALPVSVDNSQHKFFPGILDQGYNMTCQQFSGVSYLYAYEVNRLRNVSASDPGNQYPDKYTYNFMNGGNAENGVSFFYSWDAIKRQGQPGDDVYPVNDSLGNFGWMSGYDRYYAAMKNRLKQVYSIPVNTEEGILTLKHYLFDHLDGSSTGGIAVFGSTGNFNGCINPIPAGSPEAGKGILTGFFPLATHGLTIVGYNDSIRFDLNGDGRYTNDLDITGDGIVTPKDWEKGAYRVANSYGTTWEDSGYCWMMYRAFALDYDEGLAGWTPTCGVWNEAVYTLEPIADYSPLLTMKVSMNHTRRNMISVKAGISANAASQLPEYILEFPIWNYQGGELPLNMMHPELPAMEAGFDITPLLSYVEPGKTCRLFFILDEKDPDNKATGAIETVSFISYLNGTSVIPAGDTHVALTNNSSTLISAVFTPEFNKVRITNEDLPPYIPLQAYSVQMQAEGGTPPYNWSLLKPCLKIQTDSLFPIINQQELFPQSIAVPYHQVILPFAFPFQGKKYDTVYMNAYGFITFAPEELPYYYLVDEEEMIRNNKIISPLFSMNSILDAPNRQMWYETGSGRVGFRWKTMIATSNSPSEVNFALWMYPDGRFEFLYGACENSKYIGKTISGYSSGDGSELNVWTNWTLEDVSGRSYLFDPFDLPGVVSVSPEGLLSLQQAEHDKIYDLSIKVTDAANISTNKKFSLPQNLDLDARLVTTSGTIENGISSPVTLILKNVGSQNLTNVRVSMSPWFKHILFTDSIETIPALEAGAEIEIAGAFTFKCDSDYQDRSEIPFTITAESDTNRWQKDQYFHFSAPEISITSPLIHDGVDGSLDPGEVAELVFTINNSGSRALHQVTVSLTTGDTLIAILSPEETTFPSLEASSKLEMNYLLSASRFAQISDTVPMMITVHDTGSFEKTYPFLLSTGKIRLALINLTEDSSVISSLRSTLDDLGVKFMVYNMVPANISDFPIAFVSLGIKLLNSLDQYTLEDYLLRNNKMYLESYFMWKIQVNTSFCSRFHYSINMPVTTYQFQNLQGIENTFTQSMDFNYLSSLNSANYDFLPRIPAYQVFESSESHPLQIVYDGDDYKTIAGMLEFRSLSDSTDPSNKMTLMKKYLEFFGMQQDGPKAFFHSDRITVPQGGEIHFTDDSFDNIDEWHWNFPGGIPATSTLQNPVVQYPLPGTFDVSLTVVNSSGSTTIMKKDFIRVENIQGIDPIGVKGHRFILYPNPAQKWIVIREKDEHTGPAHLQVFDMKGMLVIDQPITGPEMQINLEALRPGIYVFRITASHFDQTEKVIIE